MPKMTINDPNLRFPEKFALIEDLDVFEMPDGLGLQLRGGATNLVIRGQLANTLTPWLLGEIKQQTTLENLINSRPANSNAGQIEELLLLLLRKGCLVDLTANDCSKNSTPQNENAEGRLEARQRLFWGRKLGFTRNNASAQEIERKLSEARVVLVADGLLGCCAFDILHRSGINKIDVVDRFNNCDLMQLVEDASNSGIQACYCNAETLDTLAQVLESKVETSDLLITVTRNAPPSFFNLINTIALETPIEWLRANETAVELEIGPLVIAHDTACYCCYELRARSASEHPIEETLYLQHLETLPNADPKPMLGESLAFATAGGANIAMEAIRALTKISLPVTLGAVVFNSFDGHTEQMKVKKVARCPACYRGTIEVKGETQRQRNSAYA